MYTHAYMALKLIDNDPAKTYTSFREVWELDFFVSFYNLHRDRVIFCDKFLFHFLPLNVAQKHACKNLSQGSQQSELILLCMWFTLIFFRHRESFKFIVQAASADFLLKTDSDGPTMNKCSFLEAYLEHFRLKTPDFYTKIAQSNNFTRFTEQSSSIDSHTCQFASLKYQINSYSSSHYQLFHLFFFLSIFPVWELPPITSQWSLSLFTSTFSNYLFSDFSFLSSFIICNKNILYVLQLLPIKKWQNLSAINTLKNGHFENLLAFFCNKKLPILWSSLWWSYFSLSCRVKSLSARNVFHNNPLFLEKH